MNPISKVKTLWQYTYAAWALGDDLHSKLVLATMLPRLKFSAIGVDSERLHKVRIKVDSLRRVLYFRTQDIFLIHEVLWGNPYIHPAMLQNPPRCILDLGAHIGLATLRFKASFPHAIIHCYEPDPENFKLLEKNTKDLLGVVLHQEAVGPKDTTSTLYVPIGRHSASSLFRPPENIAFYEVRCKVKSLDRILADIGSPVDLVKFDIEGIEHKVFSVSALVHQVDWIVGEMKAGLPEIIQFTTLFPYHEAQVHQQTPKVVYIFLKRRV
jgi:FkbM family methyltransferase